MTVRVLAPGEAFATAREEPTVCIGWFGDRELALQTLAGVLRHTATEVPVLLAGVAGDGEARRVEAELGRGFPQRVVLALSVDLPAGCAETGFAAAVSAACAACAGDLVFVAPGVHVGPEWLERLAAAARSDTTVVSATALADRGAGALSVEAGAGAAIAPEAVTPVQPDAALAVGRRSPRAYPRIVSAGAHCVYLRRTLLDRLGGLQEDAADAQEAVTELSLRALALGMQHVAADDVLVCVTAEPADRRDRPQTREVLVADREDERTVLRRTLACARMALRGMSLTIDARALGPSVGGTQSYTTDLILALAASEQVRVRVVVPPDLPDALARRFAEAGTLEVITYEEAVAGVQRSDVVHRPQQIFSEDDLSLLRLLGERIVIGQQDLIAYRDPAYHASVERWWTHRRVARLALTVADRVVFFSEHALRDAVGEDLVPAELCDVAGVGADAPSGRGGGVAAARADSTPAPVEPVPGVPTDAPLLVCLGADYAHKNRPFAIALHAALRERHGWTGRLVLAGGHVPYGSSREEERALLQARPELAASVLDVGAVGEAQRAWLYERARAVVYPTLYEGFGLVPFEAARAGVPCLYAPQASLVELADPRAATLIPWDAPRSAAAVTPLLADGPERDCHVRMLLDAAARARWSEVVERLLETYERAVQGPFRASAPHAWQELERERYLRELYDALGGLRASVGALAGPEQGGLLSERERRGLLRVASRPALRRALLGPIGLLGRRW